MIAGSIVALVTPMTTDGRNVDWAALKNLVDWHVAEGTNAIVSVGTTGESPTLSVDEHIEVIARTVEFAAKRIPIIAGSGANSTTEAIDMTVAAERAGVDASLQVVPYYNKPTQEGMFQHFSAIAAATKLPIILYNVPGRTVCDMRNETVLRLATVDNIVGIKDATGDLTRGRDLIAQAPADFAVYSGDDPTSVELILAGAKGNISVTANVVPGKMSQLCALALAGEADKARALDATLAELHSAMFVEPNPIPVKWALNQMGRIESGIRLPLTPLSAGQRTRVAAALRAAGLIEG